MDLEQNQHYGSLGQYINLKHTDNMDKVLIYPDKGRINFIR